MSPPGVSLKRLGLKAPGGLDCPAGGLHHILIPELRGVQAHGGHVTCVKCGQRVRIAKLDEE